MTNPETQRNYRLSIRRVMEGLTFPVGKLCRIRKVLGGELYHVAITKLNSGPVEVVAELDNDTMAPEELLANTHKMSVQEDLFVSMLEDDMIGNIELEGILSHFVKSLVLDRETKVLSAVKIDIELEKQNILLAKKEAERITQEKDKKDEEIRAQKARKRAERAQAKVENRRLAKQHLQERVAYARKIMAIEVKRLAALKKAREARNIQIEENKMEQLKPATLVLPKGILLKVRRVINSEMASVEVEKQQHENGKDWIIVFTTTGLETGIEHSLTTTETQLTALLQESDYGKDTADLLRIFSKMIAFEQTGSNPGLRLHQVDEAAEKERIRQWRNQALRVSGSTTVVHQETKEEKDDQQQQDDKVQQQKQLEQPKRTKQTVNQKKKDLEQAMLASIDDIASGRSVNEKNQLFEKKKLVGGIMYTISFRLSGHKIFAAATTRLPIGKKVEYSCSLEHAMMLLPSEQQLWDTETELFTSLFRCVKIGRNGSSLTLRRKKNKLQSFQSEEMIAAVSLNNSTGNNIEEREKERERERQRVERESQQMLHNRAIYKISNGTKTGKRINKELERKIEEHYINKRNEVDVEMKQYRNRKKGGNNIRLKSLTDPPMTDDVDSEEVQDRLRSLEQAHRFLLPASRENNMDGTTMERESVNSFSRTLMGRSNSSTKKRKDIQHNQGGFGRYQSSVMNKETILEQSSILSEQGNCDARLRLRNRLAQTGFCGETLRGPDIDPLYPLDARSKGQYFLQKNLRDAFGPEGTHTITTIMEAPNYEKLRSKASIIQEVESKMIMTGGMVFQVAAQQNSWGTPLMGGPGYRTNACKFNRINKLKNVRKKKKKTRGMLTLKG